MSEQDYLVIIATATAMAGSEGPLLAALSDVAAPTRAQPGCISFELLHSLENPGVVTAIERWASTKDHDRHLQGAHVVTLMNAMGRLLAGPPNIVAYQAVGS